MNAPVLDLSPEHQARRGDWIQTFTGVQFWPLDPRPGEIDIVDIAHSLSMQCRFAGHVHTFYSVAEHSVRASEIVPNPDMLWALLHDASEAYLVDLPRPLKQFSQLGRYYREIEHWLMAVICARFNLRRYQPDSVKEADRIMLVTEKRDVMGMPPKPWEDRESIPLNGQIQPWTQAEAKLRFLERYSELTGEVY
jgi:uncharacterized protein